MIEVANVWKRYGRDFVLRDVSLEVYPGELVAVIGTNGSGKSTLMRIVCGLERATFGAASIFGLDAWRDRRTAWRILEYLSLDERLPGAYDTYENMALFSPDATALELRRRADRLLGPDALEMPERERRLPVDALSTGKRQRAALATLEDRPVAIVDEPTAGFDPNMRRAFREHLARRRGTTLLVTHDMADVERASRVFVLASGRLVAWAPPRTLCRWLGAADPEAAYAILTSREGARPLRTGRARVVTDASLAPGECAVSLRGARGDEIALGPLVLTVASRTAPQGLETVRVSTHDRQRLGGAGEVERAWCGPA